MGGGRNRVFSHGKGTAPLRLARINLSKLVEKKERKRKEL